MDQIDVLESGAIDWIGRQRERYRSTGSPLAPEFRRALQHHYAQEVLESVRVVMVAQIENPDFYAELALAGYQIPLDFRRVEGITYGDVVLLRNRTREKSVEISLRFHELVHVVQYSILGVEEFGRRYVRGWAANGFSYSAIPLEVDAYQLQAQFEIGSQFNVVEAVRERLNRHGV